MFIDYAINDISDPDEMASFEVDVRTAGHSRTGQTTTTRPRSGWSTRPRASTTAPSGRTFTPRSRQIVAEDAPFVALDYPPYIYAVSKYVNSFAVNPGGAYRLEDVWLS